MYLNFKYTLVTLYGKILKQTRTDFFYNPKYIVGDSTIYCINIDNISKII